MGRHRRTRNEKNIRKDEATGEWIVFKKFKQLKHIHIYKTFKTFREAKSYRNYLDKNNAWIRELPDNKKVKVLKRGKNYTTTKNGHTYIYKTINYVQRFYGKYSCEEDAEKVIRQLILNNWDWDKLPDELKQLRLPSDEASKKYITTGDSPGHVTVKKYIDGELRTYGVYSSRREARKVINWLEKNNWPTELPSELIALQCPVREPKYYGCTNLGTYKISKSMNGKVTHYGTYDSEDAARNAVEELKKHNWDYEWFIANREKLKCNQREYKKGV